MAIEMSRLAAPGRVHNAGLEFDRFMPAWENDATKRGETVSAFLDQVSKRSAPNIYASAYQRWQATMMDTDQMAVWFGKIQGRLLTGLGMPHPLETQVARNRLYGVPMLPGSGLKGLARAWASQYTDLDDAAISVLFGRGGDDEGGDSGYLIFHDAWWIPNSATSPLVKEVVTVHHDKYYSKEGEVPATDFDSPNPSFQLAVRGGFMFVIEGAKPWADLAMKILRQGLEEEGFGGKVSAGYGCFMEDVSEKNAYEDARKDLFSKQKADKDKSGLSKDAADFYDDEKNGRWEEDKNAFSAPGMIEGWLDRLDEVPDPDVMAQLKTLLDTHYRGLLEDPDKVHGKKKKFIYKDRMRKVAKRFNQIT